MSLTWLKRLFSSRSPILDGRIVYSLPNPSLFPKYYNKDVLFKDVLWSNWHEVIDGFKQRFDGWYFANMNRDHSAYLDLCSLCALVEVFTHYTTDKKWHEPGHYKEFLRRVDSVFRQQLSKPIIVTRFDGGKWTQGRLKDYADVFYTGVRCSLHHHGDLAHYAGMSGTGKIAIEIANAGNSTCGKYSYSIVVFDPGKIKESLQAWLKQYCDDLKADPTSSQARDFRQKFQNDFGISIP